MLLATQSWALKPSDADVSGNNACLDSQGYQAWRSLAGELCLELLVLENFAFAACIPVDFALIWWNENSWHVLLQLKESQTTIPKYVLHVGQQFCETTL